MEKDESRKQAANLIDHPALIPLLPYLRSFARKGLTSFRKGTDKFSPLAIEQYASSVMEKVGELDNAINSLRLTLQLILDLTKQPHAKAEMYRYYYENYLLRGVGIVDRAHRLVGASFLWSKAKYEAVGGNKYVKERIKEYDPKIYASLRKIDATFQSHRSPRNEVIHSSAFSDRELGLLLSIEALKINPASDQEIQVLKSELFSVGANEISMMIQSTGDAVNELLKNLSQVYLNVIALSEPEPR